MFLSAAKVTRRRAASTAVEMVALVEVLATGTEAVAPRTFARAAMPCKIALLSLPAEVDKEREIDATVSAEKAVQQSVERAVAVILRPIMPAVTAATVGRRARVDWAATAARVRIVTITERTDREGRSE